MVAFRISILGGWLGHLYNKENFNPIRNLIRMSTFHLRQLFPRNAVAKRFGHLSTISIAASISLAQGRFLV